VNIIKNKILKNINTLSKIFIMDFKTYDFNFAILLNLFFSIIQNSFDWLYYDVFIYKYILTYLFLMMVVIYYKLL
jgi:hypothetical protein